MGKFENKVVIVTGASNGIGQATAIAFAKEGAKLFITGRNQERLQQSAKLCKESGSQVFEMIGDVTEFETLEAIVTKSIETFRQIDILINCAGISGYGTIELLSCDKYDEMFQVNVRAPVFLSKLALPHLKETKGCIVNVSSCSSLKNIPALGIHYGMSKSALDYFTRGFSAECAPFGVRVNSVNPAAVRTSALEASGMPQEMIKKMRGRILDAQPLGLMEPEDVAEVILFVCSASKMTGVSLPIDAGFLNRS